MVNKKKKYRRRKTDGDLTKKKEKNVLEVCQSGARDLLMKVDDSKSLIGSLKT